MKRIVGALAAVALLLPLGARAAEPKLPPTIAWTAYDVGSAGYNQAVAVGAALKNRLGVTLRVLPGKNDVSRQIPLREGKVQFSATGVGGSFMAQEGVFEFGTREWGPQPVRMLLHNRGRVNLSLGVAADTGVKTVADLRGRRVAWVIGSPALNVNAEAILAFGGLTWDDVVKVEFPGFGQSWDGIVNDQADAAFASTNSGKAYQLEASPRGIHWPPLPHDDEEGWQRLWKIAPYFVKNVATVGAGISEANPHEGGTYPYPILITYASQDADLVYAMTKAMVELYDDYRDGAPGADGWALANQSLAWVVPWHEGAVRYFREIGVWTEALEAHNRRLIERQQLLAKAWQEHLAAAGDLEGEAFERAWLERRAAALEAAGFEPYYR